MLEYRFPLTRIFSYKNRFLDSVLLSEYTGDRKPVFWHFWEQRIYTYYMNKGDEQQ